MSAFMIACPCCQSVFPLESALNDLAAREAVVEAFRLTPFGDLLLGYINLFKPPKRVLAMSRTARLLNELLPMIRDAKIERSGRIWSAPRDYWQQALGEMIEKRDKLTLPLKSHGYLLAIIESYGNKAEAKAETQSENRKSGRTPIGGTCLPNQHIDETCQKKPDLLTHKPRSKIPAEVLAAAGINKPQPQGD